MTRIVVMGTGSIGSRHLEILRAMPGVEVLALPTRQERVVALRAGGIQAVDSFAAAVATHPDGALIATDTGRHAADALQWLEAGCDVLVEKPLATDKAGASAVAERAAALGRTAHVACCLRFDRGIAWLAERRDSIGRLRLADAECLSWLPDWRPGRDHRDGYAARPGEGGVLLDLIHELDLVGWLAGPVARVSASLTNGGAVGLPDPVEETALLTLTLTSGAPVSVRLSYASRTSTRRLRLWGEAGLLEWDFVARHAWLRGAAGQLVEETTWDEPAAMLRAQDEAWVHALRGEPPGALAGAREGLLALALCDAARTSAASGRWEPVS